MNRHDRRATAAVHATPHQVAICTPAGYGTHPGYAQALAATCDGYAREGFAATTHTATGSHIDVVRNELAATVLATDAELLVWIDADEEWDARDCVRLCKAMLGASDVQLAALPVAKKSIDWRAVGEAARRGVPDAELAAIGVAATGWSIEFEREHVDPERGYIGPVREVKTSLGPVRLVRIRRAGAGFLAIRRSVFTRILEARGDLLQYVRYGALRHHLFASGLAPSPAGAPEWRGEDYGFAELARGLGIAMWCWPDPLVTHHGSFAYRARFDLDGEARRAAGPPGVPPELPGDSPGDGGGGTGAERP